MSQDNDDKIDRSFLAVRRQLGGMRCSQYEIGIREASSGKMIIQPYSAEQLLKSVKFLKYKNFNDCDIYIRPEGSQGLILVDDVHSLNIEGMRSQGDAPAAVVETSPDNYQVWIRVSEEAISQNVATEIAKGLARKYDGDKNSADYRHFGRLAGFTNRKPVHVDRDRGLFPYVISHQCSGEVCENGDRWLAWGQKKSVLARSQRVNLKQSAGYSSGGRAGNYEASPRSEMSPEDVYRAGLKLFHQKYGNSLDVSRVDWAVAKRLASYGYSASSIKSTLKSESPRLEERKKVNVDAYLDRTVGKVMNLPDVIKAREKLAEHQQKQVREREKPLQNKVQERQLRR